MGQVLSYSAHHHHAAGEDDGNPVVRHLQKREARADGYTNTPGNATGATWQSLWRFDGSLGYGAAPGTTPRACDHTTAGGLQQGAAGAGKTRRLWHWSAGGGQSVCMYRLFDRLADVSGLDANIATLQTISGGLAPSGRHTDGRGVEMYAEIYTLIGTTQRTATATYVNQDGTGSRTATALIGGSSTTQVRSPHDMVKFTLQSGDTGVRSVQSVQLDLGTGTPGDFGITLVYPISVIAVPASIARDVVVNFALEPDGPVDVTGACLAMAWVALIGSNFHLSSVFSFEDA